MEKLISYGESRVEVSLAGLMSHSTGRILEYLYEKEPSVMADVAWRGVCTSQAQCWGQAALDEQ